MTNQASESMKEMMIQDYLRSHPGVKRNEVITRSKNGKIVLDTIQNSFGDTNIKKSYEDRVLMKELIADGDERFMNCMDSVDSTQSYIEWLVAEPSAPFNENDLTDIEMSLQKKTQTCMSHAKSVKYSKQKMAKYMEDNADTTSAAVQVVMGEMMDATEKLLKVQHRLYKDEVRLAEQFSTHSKNCIQKHYKIMKDTLKERSLEGLRKAYAVLKKETGIDGADGEFDVAKMEFMLEQFDECVQKRRKELDVVTKVLEFVNQMVAQLAANPAEEKAPRKPKNRMVKASESSSLRA